MGSIVARHSKQVFFLGHVQPPFSRLLPCYTSHMWFTLALTNAVLAAFSVIIMKKLLNRNIPPMTLTWGVLLVAFPIVAFTTFRDTIPVTNTLFFLGVSASVVFYILLKTFGLRAMQMADLSAVYPLTTLAPLVTLLIAWFPPLNEHPSSLSLLGGLVALSGTYILSMRHIKKGILYPFTVLIKEKALALTMLAVLMEGIVITFDKIAIRNTTPESTTFTLFVEDILTLVSLIPILIIFEPQFLRNIWKSRTLFLVLGILNAISTMVGMAAVGGGNVALVSIVMKVQILIVLLLSFLFFKDKPKVHTIIGSIIMLVGIMIVRMGCD